MGQHSQCAVAFKNKGSRETQKTDYPQMSQACTMGCGQWIHHPTSNILETYNMHWARARGPGRGLVQHPTSRDIQHALGWGRGSGEGVYFQVTMNSYMLHIA